MCWVRLAPVIPLFREQIRRGGGNQLTIRISPVVMTIPQAAQLVIQAGAMHCRYHTTWQSARLYGYPAVYRWPELES